MLVRAFSPDTVEIIRDINKYSNNTMARQLFLSIGAQYRDKADKDDAWAAQRVIRNWLATWIWTTSCACATCGCTAGRPAAWSISG